MTSRSSIERKRYLIDFIRSWSIKPGILANNILYVFMSDSTSVNVDSIYYLPKVKKEIFTEFESYSIGCV